MCDSVVEPPRKKFHAAEDSNGAAERKEEKNGAATSPQKSQTTAAAADFSKLEVVRLISNSESSLAVEAKHSAEDGRVIVNIQRMPFDAEKVNEIISEETKLKQLFHNDVYSKHTAAIPSHLNEVQVTLIHPATDKHFLRYERESCTMVEETPELYESHTKPFVSSGGALSKQWIYNILSGESEADRVIFRDDDPATGFVVVPDLKWTGLQVADLYCLALIQRKDLSSIRDLTGECLPLLRNIRDAGAKAIEEKYGQQKNRLRIYFHYLPSFYHLHIHFSSLTFDAPGTWVGKAHALTDVISNLENDSDYYKKATLAFTVKDNHPHPLALNNMKKAEESKKSEQE